MRQYEMCELEFRGEALSKDWASAAPRAVLTHGAKKLEIRGFYAGDGLYKVRFLPDGAGTWKYTVTGEVNAEGSVEVEAALPENHGRVQAAGCHFEYQDGTLFTPFGTTVYALIHQTQALYETTMATLAASPFNKVRFCVFPKDYHFNKNEPRAYAFEKNPDGSWDTGRPCFAYWALLEDAVLRLQRMGTECDLILFHPYDRWGFDALPQKASLAFLDYLVRRLSAMPNVWWSMANEYDLCKSKTRADFEEIETFLAENDPYHHLLGSHNCFEFWDATRPNITHCSFQTKMLSRISEWRARYKKPVCVDECCYEGNLLQPWGSISGREMTYRFWRVVSTGGYCTHGETFYDENDVLWWAKGGVLRGESPERIRFLKKLVSEFPGPIEPVPHYMEKFLLQSPEETDKMLEAMEKQDPASARAGRSMARMSREDLVAYMATEPQYYGRVGESVFLCFFDMRTSAKALLELPGDKKYRVERIDVWNMTREVIAEGVCGRQFFDLPGREGMALLASAM